MAETGRLIYNRYLLQRLLKRGQVCEVYQGFDQVLQRSVVVKIAPGEHVAAYRAALRTTSQFSHPNIIGIYDLIVEPEHLYLVQEYVEGDDFEMLLQLQLDPYYVVDLGVQICQALVYASAQSRKVCHGDLTPATIIRDRRGTVRINNFALPSNIVYFTSWSAIGGDGSAISDRDLPWGQISEARRNDDTRAVGILLYQLLAGRPLGVTTVEPPADGRLRFSRNVPVELCELVARSIVREHPQYIRTADAFLAELKVLAETLEPPVPEGIPNPGVDAYQMENTVLPSQLSPSLSISGTGKLVNTLPVRGGSQAGMDIAAFRSSTNAKMPLVEQLSPASPSLADPMMMAEMPLARQAAYAQQESDPPGRLNVSLIIIIGLILFALFFIAGFFLAQSLLLR